MVRMRVIVYLFMLLSYLYIKKFLKYLIGFNIWGFYIVLICIVLVNRDWILVYGEKFNYYIFKS